jgi:tetratricopeptide (TPR) repeat protein
MAGHSHASRTNLSTVLVLLVVLFGCVGEASSQRPDSTATFAQGLNLITFGDYAGALKVFQALQSAKKDNPLLVYFVGVCQFNLGEFPASIKALGVASRTDSLSLRARYFRGRAYQALGQYAEAIGDFQYVLEADSGFQPARMELLRTFCQSGRFDMAAQAMSKGPDLNECLLLGRSLLSRNKSYEALAYAHTAYLLDSTQWSSRFLLADVLFSLKQYSHAYFHYASLMMENKNSSALARKMALCFEQRPMRHIPSAVMFMQKYFQLAGDTTVGDAGRMGNWYYELKQYDSAEVFFRKVVELDSTVVQGHFNRGLSLVQLERLDEAVQEFRISEILDRENIQFSASIPRSLGSTYAMKKHFRLAITSFKRSLEIDREDLEATLGLARAYDGAGRKQDALKWYKKFLNAAKKKLPDGGVIKETRERVRVLSAYYTPSE